MARVLAVNNYPTRERFERLEKSLKDSGAAVNSIDWGAASASTFNRHDGVVLSGSPDMLSDPKSWTKFSRETDAILDSEVPVLGVCYGHQLMAHAFGAQIIKDDRHVLEMVETQVLEKDPLFDGLPRSLMLLESRQEVVRSLPEGFRLLARSRTSEIAAMKHRTRSLYGVQSHPERFTRENPEGNSIIRNFVNLLE
jgi:GMP synthase (glutamine-hydrolysing)